jgi:predicted AlkP superfamily pyrophosphatase or phosphodiesterase
MRAPSILTWLAWLCLTSSPYLAENAHADQVILVSVDGLRPDAVSTLGEAGAPNFYRLRREGASTGNARADNDWTVTLPNHTGMVTGRRVVGPSGHGWTVNTDPFPGVNLHRNRGRYVASVFDVAHDHGFRTGIYASKSKFSLYDTSYDGRSGAPDTTESDNGRDKIDAFVANENTAELLTAFVAAMVAKSFDFAMLHFRDPDTAGHATNWDLASGSGYLRAVQHVDGLLGQLLDTIQKTASLNGHTWIVLTADHGGVLGTIRHDINDSPEDYTIPFMVWGPGVPAGANLYDLNATTRRDPGTSRIPYEEELQPIRNADAGNLVLSLMGLPSIPGSTVNARQDLKVR